MAVGHCGVAVSPHNYNSTTIGLAATMQAAAAMPNFLITEYFVNFEMQPPINGGEPEVRLEPFGAGLAKAPLEVENGYVRLPTSPGLGVELDEEALLARPGRSYPPRKIRQFSEEGP